MPFLQQLYIKIRELFQKMSPSQRMAFMALGATVFVALAMLILMTGGKEWDYVGSIPEERQIRVEEILQAAEIEAKWDGRVLYLPKGMRYKVLPGLAEAGLLPGHGKDFWDWLYGENITETRYKMIEKSRNSKERELSSFITKAYPIVSWAGVTLTPGENMPYIRDAKRAKASVTIRYSGMDVLSEGQVKAIASMVASSMKNLAPQDVAIQDHTGIRSVLDPDSRLAMSNERARAVAEREQYYEDKIRKFLSPMYPQFSVTVSVDLDWSKVVLREEQYDTKNPLVYEREKTKESEKGYEQTGEPGVMPSVNATIQSGPSLSNEMQKSTSKEKSKASTTVKTADQAPGDIKKIVAAIVLPREMLDGDTDGARTLDEVKKIASRAIGSDTTGDVTVTSLYFRPQEATVVAGASWVRDFFDVISLNGIILIVFAVFVLLIVRKTLQEAIPESPFEELQEKGLQFVAGEEASSEDTSKIKNIAAEKMREQVREMVKDSPNVAAMLIKRWLATKD